MKKPKRMFVMMEVESTMTARDVHDLVENADISMDPEAFRVLQVHVNVAKPEKSSD